jgi:hypothetical protein
MKRASRLSDGIPIYRGEADSFCGAPPLVSSTINLSVTGVKENLMSVLMGFRNTNPPSPFRAAYGVRGGTLLFPLDVVFSGFNPDRMDTGIAFIGSPIDGPGFPIGTVINYTWPLVGPVLPLVDVAPDPGLNLAALTQLPPGPPAPVAPGTIIQVENMGGSIIRGTVHPLSTVSYIDFTHTIDAYPVEFNPPLHPDDHGLAVVLAADANTVVGMVISTKPFTGVPNTFVIPV